jgi:hypothetical protein
MSDEFSDVAKIEDWTPLDDSRDWSTIFTIRIVPFPCDGETHYAVFDGDKLIAFCNYESSAIAVRDDAIRHAGKAERRWGDLCQETKSKPKNTDSS